MLDAREMEMEQLCSKLVADSGGEPRITRIRAKPESAGILPASGKAPKAADKMPALPGLEAWVFKIPDARRTNMYCVEFTGDPDDGEFKALVEHHGLTGLQSKLVWSDED